MNQRDEKCSCENPTPMPVGRCHNCYEKVSVDPMNVWTRAGGKPEDFPVKPHSVQVPRKLWGKVKRAISMSVNGDPATFHKMMDVYDEIRKAGL